jgi:hypothetical protein
VWEYVRPVSLEDVEVAKQFAAAADAGDREGTFALLADDVEWTTPHRTLRGLAEVREKLIGGGDAGGGPENLDVEFEDGDWEELDDGHVARETRCAALEGNG